MDGEDENILAETDPSKVLKTPELLDNILSFLNLEDLYLIRQVSQYTRSTSNLTLRRRLYAEEQDQSEYEETRIFNLFLRETETCRPQARLWPTIPPAPIPPELDNETEIQFGISHQDNVPGIPKRLPLLLRTVLTFDWSSRIKRLTLRCQVLSVQEWNLIGVYLLSCLKALRHLRLVELDSRLEISPEWGEDMPVVVDPTLVVSQLEFLLMTYAHNDQDFELQDRLLDLAFLDNCPKLQTLKLNYMWTNSLRHTRHVSTTCTYEPSSDSSPTQIAHCTVSIPYNFVENDSRIIELNSHLQALKPKALQLTGTMTDYPAVLPIEVAKNLSSLSLDARIDINAEWIISSLSRLEALSGITNLSLTYNPLWAEQDTPLPRLKYLASTTPADQQMNSLLNVVSLTLDGLDGDCLCHAQARAREPRFFLFNNTWPTPERLLTLQMWEQAAGFLPKVKVLNVTADCQCFIKHMHRFQWLGHLVVGLRSEISDSARLFKEQVRMLKELRTVTVCFNDEPADEDIQELRSLVEVMALARKLQAVQICYPAPEVENMPDLEAIIRSEIPELTRLKLVIRKTEEGDVEGPSLESLEALVE